MKVPTRQLLALTLATGLIMRVGIGQVLDEPVKGFQVAEHDKDSGRRKWVLSGATAENISNEQLELTGARMEFFADNGVTNLIVTTPKCYYNTRLKEVSSPGDLKVGSGSGEFSLEGTGFGFRKADTSLLISNNVHAIIHKGASRAWSADSTNLVTDLKVPVANDESGSNQVLHIYSERFFCQTNQGTFHDKVRVVDPQGTLNCGVLTIQIAEPGRTIDRIAAEQQVVVTSGETRATGEKGLYELATDQVSLTGNPTWRLGPREGSAKELVFERKAKRFRALREVRMQLPPGSMNETGFLLSDERSMPMPKTADNRPVYVKCDEFVITQGNVATNPTTTICRGNVSVDDARGTLRCSTLTIESQANSRRPERVIAEGDVVVEQSDKRLACTRAVYLAADERIDVTGPTNWRMGDREGSSDRLSMDLTNKTYRAIGAVRMRLPSGSGGNFLWLTPTESLSAESESAAGKPKITGSPEPVDISSDDFEFRSARPPSDLDEVVYRGNVRVRGPQDMTLDCRTLTGKIPPGTNQMQTLIAEQNVIVRVKSPAGDRIGRGDIATYDGASEELEFTGTNQVEIVFYDKSGETLARGKRIVYSRKSDVAVMTGNPVVTSEKGVITGETLVMDRSKGVLKATGGWRLRIPTNSVAQVSLPAPPKKTKR